MSIKPLLDQLHRDALEDRAQRLAAAREHALRVCEDAERLSQRQRRDALAERERALRTQLDSERAVIARQCQLEELQARRRLVERCLSATAGQTADLRRRNEFAVALRSQARRARGYLPEGACRIRCAPSLEELLRDAGLGDGAEIVADGAIDFGFVLESPDGSVRVDATLATLIAQERDALAIEIVRRYQAQSQ